jgi:hypothetical protein
MDVNLEPKVLLERLNVAGDGKYFVKKVEASKDEGSKTNDSAIPKGEVIEEGGEFHDQGDTKYIVIKRLLWGHNDPPCRRPAPDRPIGCPVVGRPQIVFGGLSYN